MPVRHTIFVNITIWSAKVSTILDNEIKVFYFGIQCAGITIVRKTTYKCISIN